MPETVCLSYGVKPTVRRHARGRVPLVWREGDRRTPFQRPWASRMAWSSRAHGACTFVFVYLCV